MATYQIDGYVMEKMLVTGLKNIQLHQQKINDMNVFPVPDGDTGTNLRMTLQNGVLNAKHTSNCGSYLKTVKRGMLLGARGNSGVIISQLFSGLASSLEDKAKVTAADLQEAFISAYKAAYAAVIRPVEGTILTVAREGIEKIICESDMDIETLMSMYIDEMRISLNNTPNLLPLLKESGVLDSGAAGYIIICEGMLKGLKGEDILVDDSALNVQLPQVQLANSEFFNKDSKFEDGYCTEFILQLLSDKKYKQDFSVSYFNDELLKLGNSLVLVRDEDRVKVHIHTLTPSKVIELAQKYGEFVTFKMENMQIQHNEHDFHLSEEKKNTIKKDFAVVAVTNGEGFKNLYSSFGCDVILEGGATMNTSAEDFYNAFNSIDAKMIAVLPNNKNVFLAAKQAIELSGKKNIKILDSTNLVSGYFSLALSQLGSEDAKENLKNMKEAIDSVDVISVAKASKSYTQDNINCKKNDYIAVIENKVVSSSNQISQAVKDAILQLKNFESKESCCIFTGNGASEETNEMITEAIESLIPDIEIDIISGGQEVYPYIIGF